jgi:uncharacterized protein (DUF362 family)
MAKFNRRSFIKTGAAVGTGTMLSGAGNTFAGLAADSIDISVVKGENFYENTKKAIEILGGIDSFVKTGDTVGILMNSPWTKPGTFTSPEVAITVVEMCFEAGAKEVICLKKPRKDYWDKLPEKYNSVINRLSFAKAPVVKSIPRGISLKEAEITPSLLEVDVFINIPVSKNHTGTNFTANLKNLMGACPHSTCRKFHFKEGNSGGWYDDISHLSQCIADVNLIRKPDLCVVDSTVFVESGGPGGPGPLLKPHKVVAGRDAVAIDSYVATFLGLQMGSVDMVKFAHAHGIGEMDYTKLNIKEA